MAEDPDSTRKVDTTELTSRLVSKKTELRKLVSQVLISKPEFEIYGDYIPCIDNETKTSGLKNVNTQDHTCLQMVSAKTTCWVKW